MPNASQTDRRPAAAGPRRLRRTTLALLLIVAGGAGLGLGVGPWAAPAAENPAAVDRSAPLPVAALTLEAQDGYEIARSFAGRIVAARISQAGFERGGLLVEMLADDGDRVAAGAVLARLDTRLLESERAAREAELAEAEARLELARRTRERQAVLVERGHSSEQRFDDVAMEEQALAARVDRLRTAIASIDIELDKSVLRAPFDAVVARRLMDEGTVAEAGRPLFRLLEVGAAEARVNLPARLAAGLAAGDAAELEIGEATVQATVAVVLPDLDPATRTVTVVLRAEAGRGVPSGELVRLELTERVTEPGFWLPIAALTEGLRGLWTVYALVPANPSAEPDGEAVWRVEPRAVEILHTDGRHVHVRGTLADGDRIVAGGLHRLARGQRVRIAETVAPAGAPLDQPELVLR